MAYTKIKNFKFWCQKVLPLVYDDSLSYYEVLCKIRDYINEIIANMDELASLIEDLDSRVDALEDEIENISESIIQQIREYLGSDEFISQLVEALQESQTFNNWFKDFITNNEELIRDLINSDYFDQYFKDYFTNNTDLIQQLLNSDAFSQYFQNAFDGTTDFYESVTVAGDNVSAGGLTSNFYAIGRESQIETGTRLKLMYAPTLTPIVGKFDVTESGGFYNYASDGDTNYTSFIIDMNGYSGRNLYFYIAESFDPFSLILVKRGSLDTGGQSVTSDKSSTIQQVAYVPGTWTSNWVATNKKVNYAIVSIKNNGVAFNPIFTYSIKNVDYDVNTDNPIMVPHNIYAVWDGASDTAISSLELYKPKNDLAYIIFGMLGSTQYGLNEEVNVVDSDVSNMQEDIEELKNSVSDGKAQVASAITDKGVATASDATFDTMATNIRNIPTGDANNLFGYLNGNYTDIDNYDITQLGFVDLGITSSSYQLRTQLDMAGVNVTDLEDDTFYILPAVTGSNAGWSFLVTAGGSIYLQFANGAHRDYINNTTYPTHLYIKILSNGGLLIGNPYNDATIGGVLGFFGASSAFELNNNTSGFFMFSNIFPNRYEANSARIYVSASPTSGGTNNILRKSLEVYTDEYLYIEPAVSTMTYGTSFCTLDNLSVPYCAKNYLEGDASNGYIFTDNNGNVFWLVTARTATTATNTQKVCVRLSD